MYNLDNIIHLLDCDQVETNELQLEHVSIEREFNSSHTRLLFDLVDCEPSIY